MNNQGKSITIKQNVPFKGGMDLYPKNTQSIKFKMAELQDIIDFKMGDIRTIARLKLGNTTIVCSQKIIRSLADIAVHI